MGNSIINNAKSIIVKTGFTLKKHSPEILITFGIIGTVVSAVMACKATTRISRIIEESKETINTIHNFSDSEEYSDKYTEEDKRKDLTIVYLKTGFDLVKLYAPSVILGALSITSILASNNILRKRNVALAAAYTAIDKSFKEYRNRVAEKLGEEVEKELRYNIKAKEIEDSEKDENGKETIQRKTIKTTDGKIASPYAVFFDEASPSWEKDSEYNKFFLNAQQQYANDLLISRGFLFLNEVYDMIGVPRTKAGQIVGWIYDKDNPMGDNYVDFGIYNIDREASRDFVNGYERSILLDFNVDGDILDRIPTEN